MPGNPAASGTALKNAVNGIAAPSSTNRWLVKVEPGIYDVGTTPLQLRSWVDVEGSGINSTIIQGTVDGSTLVDATVNGASNLELRLLTVQATATATTPYVIAMYNQSASNLRLYRVKFAATAAGSGSVWGIRNGSSSPLVEESEIAVAGIGTTDSAYGIVFNQLPVAGRSAIQRSRIHVSGAQQNYGVYMIEAKSVNEIRDTRITVSGGQNTYGLYATGPAWSGSEALIVRDTEISSFSGSVSSTGAFFAAGTTVGFDVTDSKIFGHIAPATYGIRQNGLAAMGLQSAAIVGFTKTIETASSVSIASTLLNGGPVTAAGWLGCMGVWDESGVFYANSCP